MAVAPLRKFIRASSGVAAIEFAFLSVVLVAILLVVTDFGLAANRKMQVQSAAQAGAQYAMAKGYKPVSIVSAVENATSHAVIEANPAPVQFCGCPLETGVEVAVCGESCTGGSTAGTYVTVSAAGNYQPILPNYFMPKKITFNSVSTARIK